MSFYIFGLVTYGSRCTSTSVFASVSGSNVLSYYVIIIFIIYNYAYNRVTSICIDLSNIKLFVLVFVLVQLSGNAKEFKKKFGAMHFIYQINRLTTTKVDSTYLG